MLGIRVISVSGAVLAQRVSALFGDAGGNIGRGSDCTLVLPDPSRRISRHQALIGFRAGRYFIRQIGTNLAIEVDGLPLPLDVDVPLDSGAQIRIGDYLLRAEVAGDEAPAWDGSINGGEPVAGGVPSGPEVDLLVGEPTGARWPSSDSPPYEALTVPQVFAALYSGLGLPVPEPAQQSTEDLERIGALLRHAIDGTLALLSTRLIAKREFGATATIPGPRENNPLKFAPEPDAALAHLLGPPQRGFIPPLAAVTDAFNDLRAHEIALLTGMRAALSEVVSRFDPAVLEPRLTPKAAWESLLPGSREAKLWVRFGERYAEITRDIESDFDSLFSRAFREAYERQLAELGRPPGRSGSASS
jgi:predicted component of type VI protein secretion system